MFLKTPDDKREVYILEVDLHTPEDLHDKFKEFPPCPEIMAPSVDLFSDYQKKLMITNKIKVNKKSTKLFLH